MSSRLDPLKVVFRPIIRFRLLWAAANDRSIPGNYTLIANRVDWLAIAALMVALAWLTQGGLLPAICVVFAAFILGWQYHWLQRVRVVRKEQNHDG